MSSRHTVMTQSDKDPSSHSTARKVYVTTAIPVPQGMLWLAHGTYRVSWCILTT